MAARGSIKPGSLTARVLAAVTATDRPVGRAALLGPLSANDRIWLSRTLDRLITLGHIRECRAGYAATGASPAPVAAGIRDPEQLSPGQRATLAAVIGRAHRYAGAGCPHIAAGLLERAAVRRLPAHVQQDLGALAALFLEAGHAYRDVAPARAAA